MTKPHLTVSHRKYIPIHLASHAKRRKKTKRKIEAMQPTLGFTIEGTMCLSHERKDPSKATAMSVSLSMDTKLEDVA